MPKVPLTPDELRFLQRTHSAAVEGRLYDVLHVEPDAPTPVIDRAFRDFALRWHPDHLHHREIGDHDPMIQDNLRVATEAWKTLCDERRRAAYDSERRARPPAPAPPPHPRPPQGPEVSGFEVTISVVDGRLRPSSADTAPTAPARGPRAPSVTDRFKQLLAEQFARAKGHYEHGKAEAAAGRWSAAQASYYLATRFDPDNALYRAAHADAAARARRTGAAAAGSRVAHPPDPKAPAHEGAPHRRAGGPVTERKQ